jgi:hypothetical protein
MGTAQATNYLENYLIDHLFRTRTFAKPSAVYVALFTSAPSDTGGGTEVTGGSYARKDVSPADATWTATQGGSSGNSTGTNGQTTNVAAITFPLPTADWGTVTHFALMDASTGGNMLIWDQLTAPRTILSGDPAPEFSAGALSITIG